MTHDNKDPESSPPLKNQLLPGERFFSAFYRLLQMAKLHQDNNPTLIDCAEIFAGSLKALGADENHVTVQISGGRFYLQDEKLAYHRKSAGLIQNMLQYFEARGLPGLRFSTCPDKSFLGQILAFVRLLNQSEKQPDPLAWIAQKISREEFSWVELVGAGDSTQPEPLPVSSHEKKAFERRKKARRTYSCALNSVKDVAERISSQKRVGTRKVIRIVQNMVDIVIDDEPLLMGLSTLRDHDDYTFSHSVNVAILSMCLGKRIGLSHRSLESLGACGLLHDLGKVEVPLEILGKPDKLTHEEFEEIKQHPLNSVRQIIRLKASRDIKSRTILAPFEHHLQYNLGGYPQSHRKTPLSLFGRILAIADTFDAMTTPRVYQSPFSPESALSVMRQRAGTFLDPLLLKVFITMLGRYPVGTLLELDSGEMGLVTEPSPESIQGFPWIMLLLPDGRGGFERGELVDLAETVPETGELRRNIIQSFHPSRFGIQPASFLFNFRLGPEQMLPSKILIACGVFKDELTAVFAGK